MEHPSNEGHGTQNPDNAVLLDEIETLLQELSSEHGPADASGDAAEGQARDSDPKPKMPQGPNLSVSAGYDLAKPVDYPADAARYDYRRASQGPQAEVAIQSMARKLAPDRDAEPDEPLRQQHPQAEEPSQRVSDGFHEPAGGSAAGLEPHSADPDDDEAERLNQRRRRLRLRPARRVPGSRPEAQFANYQMMNQTPDSEWDPRLARTDIARRSTQSGVIGAGVMLLLVAGVAGAFMFVNPLNRLVSGDVSPTAGSQDGVAVANIAGGTENGLELQSGKQDRAGAAPNASGTQDSVAMADNGNGTATTTNPAIASLKPAIPPETPAQPNESTAFLPAATSPATGQSKSSERLDQDAVVQAKLNDLQQRALASSGSNPSADNAAENDPVTTGSIADSAADEQIRGANAVARQASASHAGRVSKRTFETEETVKVAGLTPNAPFSVIQGETQAPSGASETAPQQEQAPPQQVASTENTDFNTVNVNRAVSGISNSAAGSAPLRGSNVDSLLARGHELLQQGDIASARLIFQRVVAMGDSRGAKGMGMTYDPRVFEDLPVAGMTADIEQAEYWYQRAREFSAVKQTPGVTETDRMPASGN